MNIRSAHPHENYKLSLLAFNSKSYWGYCPSKLEQYRNELTITAEELDNDICFILENNNFIIGFYILSSNFNVEKVNFFFIAHEYIGKGYGKFLWNHLLKMVTNLGWQSINITTDQFAFDRFYKNYNFKIQSYGDNTLGTTLHIKLDLNS